MPTLQMPSRIPPDPATLDLGPDTHVGTVVFARLINRSPRRVQMMCDEGILVEGRDWWRAGRRGWYVLRRRSAMEICHGLRSEETRQTRQTR